MALTSTSPTSPQPIGTMAWKMSAWTSDTPETNGDCTPYTDYDGYQTPITDRDGVHTPYTDFDGTDSRRLQQLRHDRRRAA